MSETETIADWQRTRIAEWSEAHGGPFGSGDLYIDLGYVHPRKVRVLHALAHQLAYHTGNGERRSKTEKQLTLTPAEIAARAHVEVALVERLLRGIVRDVEPWDLLRIMLDAGLDVYVDVLPGEDARDSITI